MNYPRAEPRGIKKELVAEHILSYILFLLLKKNAPDFL